MSIKNVVLIGAGNVATNLGKAIKSAGFDIKQVYSRTEKSAKDLSMLLDADYTCALDELYADADLYIISVSDSVIIKLLEEINLTDKLIVHTAGSISVDIFSNKFNNYGVLYPLQTFSKGRSVSFKNVPMCIEANNKRNENELLEFSNRFSNNLHVINSEKRTTLHLTAVFACNFVNHMYTMSELLLEDSKMSFDILRPLVYETAKKAMENFPVSVQTGPAKRNDINVIEKHIELLSDKPEYQKMYRFVTDSIRDFNKEDI